MKNKKMIALVIAIVVLVAGVAVYAMTRHVPDGQMTEYVPAQNESAQPAQQDAAQEEELVIEVVDIQGMITEIADDYVMMDAGEMGMIQANISDDTLIEGVDELTVGQTAVILYDGKMTRSIPAQITALKIGVYEVKGTVTEIAEGRMTIAKADGEEVVLTLPESTPEIAVGDAITAYTTGVSTMSLPPQMNAIAIVK